MKTYPSHKPRDPSGNFLVVVNIKKTNETPSEVCPKDKSLDADVLEMSDVTPDREGGRTDNCHKHSTKNIGTSITSSPLIKTPIPSTALSHISASMIEEHGIHDPVALIALSSTLTSLANTADGATCHSTDLRHDWVDTPLTGPWCTLAVIPTPVVTPVPNSTP